MQAILGAAPGGAGAQVLNALADGLRHVPTVIMAATVASRGAGAVPRALSRAFASAAAALAVLGGSYASLGAGRRAEMIDGGEGGVVVGAEAGAGIIVVAQDSDPRAPTRLPAGRVLPLAAVALAGPVAGALEASSREIVTALHAALGAPSAAAGVMPTQAVALLADLRARAALAALTLFMSDAPGLAAAAAPLLSEVVAAAGASRRDSLRAAATSEGNAPGPVPTLGELVLRAHYVCGALYERPQLPAGAIAAAGGAGAAADAPETIGSYLAQKAAKTKTKMPKAPKNREIVVGDRVRVRPDVTPSTGWGQATHASVGIVTAAPPGGNVTIDFTGPDHRGWNGVRGELELIAPPGSGDDEVEDGEEARAPAGPFSVTDVDVPAAAAAGAAASPAAADAKPTGAAAVAAGLVQARHRAWSYAVASLQLVGAVAAGEAAAAFVRAWPGGVPLPVGAAATPAAFVSVVQGLFEVALRKGADQGALLTQLKRVVNATAADGARGAACALALVGSSSTQLAYGAAVAEATARLAPQTKEATYEVRGRPRTGRSLTAPRMARGRCAVGA